MTTRPLPDSVDQTLSLLGEGDYVAERSTATALFLALKLGRPLFLEGEAGVGKTEAAKVLARNLKRRLIRLQCYEGLDIASAAYEWNYAGQMLEIRIAETAAAVDREQLGRDVFSDRFLVRRPLLEALEPDPAGPPVLLIDELDRADEPFEAFLLEMLSDFQMTIPEIGTIKASEPPVVVITSNRTREIHDALKRRCFYHWIDYPDARRELEILARKVPGAARSLSRQVVAFVQRLRREDLFKLPGVAETIDWTEALTVLDQVVLTDLESTNGTNVNGEPVQLRLLRPGDRVAVGRSVLLFGTLEEIAASLKDQKPPKGGDVKSEVTVQPDEAFLTDLASSKSGFAVEEEDDAFDVFDRAPPELPLALSPAQAAQLSEVLDYLHRALAHAVEPVHVPPNAAEARLPVEHWQRLQAVQLFLARYSRKIAEPDAELDG